MAKRTKNKPKEDQPPQDDAWISPRSGRVVIAVLSILLAVWMTWQIAPALGLGEAVLWGVGFGASIWFIFYGMQLFQRWLRKR